jgi:hypothetical protein
MRATTDTVRDQGFLPLQCDIPQEVTLSQYRARRTEVRLSWRPRLLRRRRARRPDSAA